MSSSIEKPESPPAKVDPGTLVLRGRPRPARRFRRGLIVGIAAIVSASLSGVVWIALDPPGFSTAAQGKERIGDPTTARPDALEGVPRDYAEIPKLGPPLPGDLGRPILRRQRTAMDRPVVDDGSESRRIQLEGERIATARASSIIVALEDRPRATLASAVAGSVSPSVAARSADDVANSPSPHNGLGSGGETNPHQLSEPASPWLLNAGTLIPASLITGINSDLPGLVLAQVTENVRDSATGHTVLIPQGARLIGEYGSDIGYGQSRVLLVWQRIIFPDASSIRLDKFPAADRSGLAGLGGKVDFHSRRLIEGIALSTALGVRTEFSLGDNGSELARAIRESSQQNAARAGDQITSRNLDVRPTIKVPPGSPVHAIVNKDLVLRPWKG